MNKPGGACRATGEDPSTCSAAWPALRRQDHRGDPGQATPAHRYRPAVDPRPGRQRCASSTTSPPASPTAECHTRRRRCRRGHRQQGREDPGRQQGHLYRWLRDGFITGEQITPGAPWQIRIDQAAARPDRARGARRVAALDEAAAALGIARQTVLHKVQRGELQAVHVNRGRRKACESRSDPTRLDCSTHPHERHAQC